MDAKELNALKPGDRVMVPSRGGYVIEMYSVDDVQLPGYKEVEVTFLGYMPTGVMIEPPVGSPHWIMPFYEYEELVGKYGQAAIDATGVKARTTRGWWVTESAVRSKVGVPKATTRRSYDPGGCNCAWCGEFYPYAEPNQPDGTLKCYGCREDPYRSSALSRW